MCGIPNIDIRYLINGVSLLKVRIKVPFFAYPHFYFQEVEGRKGRTCK